jgi:hypothetical protein
LSILALRKSKTWKDSLQLADHLIAGNVRYVLGTAIAEDGRAGSFTVLHKQLLKVGNASGTAETGVIAVKLPDTQHQETLKDGSASKPT